MPNTQTSVPLYAQGEVLTAANLNLTNSGIPVFATTVTRDAAFGGANEKVLAEGQFAYIEATNTTQYYDGAAWQAVGASGLTLISATTIGTTVTSVTVSSAFSATYDNYLITLAGGVASTGSSLRMVLGATSTGYYSGGIYNVYSSASTTATNQNNTAFWNVGAGVTTSLSTNITLYSPNLAKRTLFEASYIAAVSGGDYGRSGGFLDDATAYTAFTISIPTGTMTGGTIRVYGYANS